MNVAMNVETGVLLSDLLSGLIDIEVDLEVYGLSLNSAVVHPGDAFIALPGSQCHGIKFAREAISKGAIVVIYDPKEVSVEDVEGVQSVDCIAIPNLTETAGMIAARYYGYPSKKLQVIGITGTNGKTSCSQFLGQVLEDCSVIGTLGWGQWGKLNSTINTTPDAVTLQNILAQIVVQKQKNVAMEVSSHGLVQNRVENVVFTGAVITNISRDHLDYHGSMTAYVAAKTSLLKTPELQYVVLNLDDPYYEDILADVPKRIAVIAISRYGRECKLGNTLQAENIIFLDQGLQFEVIWKGRRLLVEVSIYGEFNIENLLAVLAVLLFNGMTLKQAVERLELIQPIPGRMESFYLGKDYPRVFIDYAHTPDALKNVLLSARAYCQQKLWVVFGCGGDRDQGKRSLMGEVAEKYAEHMIVTDDNPRSEDTEQIVNDILSGCTNKSIEVIHGRELAIRSALQQAGPDDCVVIAGKGHEIYQEILGKRIYFSDRKLLKEITLGYRAI